MGSMQLVAGQINQCIQPPRATLLQQWVAQHRTKRGRQRQGQRRGHPVATPTFDHLKQRQVGLDNGFKEPALLEEPFVLRMTGEWQVCVEYERDVTLHLRSKK